MSVLGHQLPRHLAGGASARPLKAATPAIRHRGGERSRMSDPPSLAARATYPGSAPCRIDQNQVCIHHTVSASPTIIPDVAELVIGPATWGRTPWLPRATCSAPSPPC